MQNPCGRGVQFKRTTKGGTEYQLKIFGTNSSEFFYGNMTRKNHWMTSHVEEQSESWRRDVM